jgi:NADH-quinone oxidoreductase subunit N
MLATVFSVMLLSLAGIPLTAGFIGKFYIVVSGVDAELWSLLVIVVIGSGIGIFYYLRTIFAMTKRTMVTSVVHVPQTAGWTLAAVTLLLLVFGIYPTPVIEWVSRMAQAMT